MDGTSLQVKPWQQQPGEPNLWFDRFFSYYRTLGATRSLEQAYQLWAKAEKVRREQAQRNQGLTPTAIRLAKRPTASWYKASKAYNWESRAMAWDIDQRRQQLEAEEAARKEMLANHQKLATAMLQGVARRLNELLGTASNPQVPQLSARELKEWLALAVKIERESRGLPGEITQQELNGELQQSVTFAGFVGGLNLANMDDDDLLDRIAELEKELGKQPINRSEAGTATIEGRASEPQAAAATSDDTGS